MNKKHKTIFVRHSPLEDMYVSREIVPELRVRRGFSTRTFSSLLWFAVPTILALAQISVTVLHYADVEATTGNSLVAGPLDVLVDADAPRVVALQISDDGIEHGVSFAPFILPALSGTLPFTYTLSAHMTGGDEAFCNALYVQGTEPPFTYDDVLLALALGPTVDQTPWHITLYLREGVYADDGVVCYVDFVYSAFKEGGAEGTEYHDEERLSLMITYKYKETIIEESASVLGTFSGKAPFEEEVEETVSESAPEPEPEEVFEEEFVTESEEEEIESDSESDQESETEQESEEEPEPEPEPEPTPEPEENQTSDA